MLRPQLRGTDGKCPIEDDVPEIYGKMKEADVIVIAVPTYGGRPSGLYCAFKERAQELIAQNYEEFEKTILGKIVALIVIGNVPAGGDLAYHTVVSDHRSWKYPSTSLLLQSREYGQPSIDGTLIEDERVKDRLDSFAKLVLERWGNKR